MSGLVIWITGLPGSGKSTVAEGIKRRFPHFVILRMDELRKVVTPTPTYSEAERDTVYRSIVYMAKTLADLGHNVLIDATGNMRKWRDLARQMIPRYAEIYLKCRIEVCTDRERARGDAHSAPRDIYRKGEAGWPVPGLQAPYEEPLSPEVTIETDTLSFEQGIALAESFIAERLAPNE